MSAKGQPRFRKFVPTDVALDIVQAMDHPGLFKQWFDGPSWDGWRAVLKAGFLAADERGGDRVLQVGRW